MPDGYTIPGKKPPDPEGRSPTLYFHRWQPYDLPSGDGPGKLSRKGLIHPYLDEVARSVQQTNRAAYPRWHSRYSEACSKLEAEPPLPVITDWRLVAGWATNPALEVGLTLDHLYGFPYVPGAAVKGLMHRMAEQELVEPETGLLPAPPEEGALPAEPPAPLVEGLGRAELVRALFGSLTLRRPREGGADAPDCPHERLERWSALIVENEEPGADESPWTPVARRLEALLSPAATGGMVTCFDAVPAQDSFHSDRDVLLADVLTPHEPKPNPIHFLAVRDGVTFELRYRLAAWPAEKPRDPEERFRSEALGELGRSAVAERLRDWLICGLGEEGLGGKTTAGYGYLFEDGNHPIPPQLVPEPELAPAERWALEALPDQPHDPADALDKAIGQAGDDAELLRQLAVRFAERHPEVLAKWRGKIRPAIRKRLRLLEPFLPPEPAEPEGEP